MRTYSFSHYTANLYFSILIFSILLILMTNRATAQQLQIGISFSIPPYVITSDDSGIELDILRAAFAEVGYTIEPHYLPLARTIYSFERGKLDGTVNVKEGVLSRGYYSDIAITFHNVAISLEKNRLSVEHLNDLKGKDIVAFQKATDLLGKDYADVIRQSKNYREYARQIIQINLLFKERTDIIVMEYNIFKYLRQKASEEGLLSNAEGNKSVVIHQIFPPTDYRFVFKTEKQRDDFNKGLATIRGNGVYQEIFRQYDAVDINQ